MNSKKSFCFVISLVVFFISLEGVFAASAGPNNPGTAINDTSVGTVGWANPQNVFSSDNVHATALLHDNESSYYNKVTNFGFNLSPSAVIKGILVQIERSAGNASTINDSRISIVKSGAVGLSSKANGTAWPTSDANVSYGNNSDLWDESWKAKDINSAKFGVAISAIKFSIDGDAISAKLDQVTITVYYNNPPDKNNDNLTLLEDSGANIINVLANDVDVNGDNLTIISVTQGTNGSVLIINSSRNLTYAPNPNFFGSDSFTYTISDGNGGEDTGIVTVTVNNVNDAPYPPSLISPLQNALTNESSPTFVWNATSDPENDSINYTILIDDDANFSSPTINESALLTTNLTSNINISAGKYNWKVVADDGNSNNSNVESEIHQFQIMPSNTKIAVASISTAGNVSINASTEANTVLLLNVTNSTNIFIAITNESVANIGLIGLGKFIEITTSNPSSIVFPVTIRIYYTDSEVSSAGIDEPTLAIFFFNTTSSSWQKEPSSFVDTSANVLSASLEHFSTYGVYGSSVPTVVNTPSSTNSLAKEKAGHSDFRWQCSPWSECTSAGIQTRTCTNIGASPGTYGKPNETQTCTYVAPSISQTEQQVSAPIPPASSEQNIPETNKEEAQSSKDLGASTGKVISLTTKPIDIIDIIAIFVFVAVIVGAYGGYYYLYRKRGV